jgi:hypothetical protein
MHVSELKSLIDFATTILGDEHPRYRHAAECLRDALLQVVAERCNGSAGPPHVPGEPPPKRRGRPRKVVAVVENGEAEPPALDGEGT